jgi:hypothetical protein
MPPADMPRLKNRACTPNRGVSGISRTANAIFKRLFYFPLGQRTKLKGRVIPIELHNGSVVNNSPMQCEYNVFTHWAGFVKFSADF